MTARLVSRTTMLALIVLALAAALGTGVASARSHGFKQRFAPVNTAIRADGNSVGAELQSAAKQTDAQLAVAFANLATRTANLTKRLSALAAPASYATAKRKLTLALLAGAKDLLAIAKAAQAHDANAARTSTKRLVVDSAKIRSTRVALAGKLGLP